MSKNEEEEGEREVSKAESLLQLLKEEIESKEDKFHKFEKENKDLKLLKENSEMKYEKLVKDGDELKEDLTKKIKDLEDSLQTTQIKQKRLQEQNKKFQEELAEKNKDTFISLKETWLKLNEQMNAVMSERTCSITATEREKNLEADLRAYRKKIDELGEGKAVVQQQLDFLRSDFIAVTQSNVSLKKKLQETEKELNEVTDHFENKIAKLLQDLSKHTLEIGSPYADTTNANELSVTTTSVKDHSVTPASSKDLSVTPASARDLSVIPASARDLSVTPASDWELSVTPASDRDLSVTPASATDLSANTRTIDKSPFNMSNSEEPAINSENSEHIASGLRNVIDIPVSSVNSKEPFFQETHADLVQSDPNNATHFSDFTLKQVSEVRMENTSSTLTNSNNSLRERNLLEAQLIGDNSSSREMLENLKTMQIIVKSEVLDELDYGSFERERALEYCHDVEGNVPGTLENDINISAWPFAEDQQALRTSVKEEVSEETGYGSSENERTFEYGRDYVSMELRPSCETAETASRYDVGSGDEDSAPERRVITTCADEPDAKPSKDAGQENGLKRKNDLDGGNNEVQQCKITRTTRRDGLRKQPCNSEPPTPKHITRDYFASEKKRHGSCYIHGNFNCAKCRSFLRRDGKWPGWQRRGEVQYEWECSLPPESRKDVAKCRIHLSVRCVKCVPFKLKYNRWPSWLERSLVDTPDTKTVSKSARKESNRSSTLSNSGVIAANLDDSRIFEGTCPNQAFGNVFVGSTPTNNEVNAAHPVNSRIFEGTCPNQAFGNVFVDTLSSTASNNEVNAAHTADSRISEGTCPNQAFGNVLVDTLASTASNNEVNAAHPIDSRISEGTCSNQAFGNVFVDTLSSTASNNEVNAAHPVDSRISEGTCSNQAFGNIFVDALASTPLNNGVIATNQDDSSIFQGTCTNQAFGNIFVNTLASKPTNNEVDATNLVDSRTFGEKFPSQSFANVFVDGMNSKFSNNEVNSKNLDDSRMFAGTFQNQSFVDRKASNRKSNAKRLNDSRMFEGTSPSQQPSNFSVKLIPKTCFLHGLFPCLKCIPWFVEHRKWPKAENRDDVNMHWKCFKRPRLTCEAHKCPFCKRCFTVDELFEEYGEKGLKERFIHIIKKIQDST